MIGFAPVERLLYTLAQFDIINEIQNVDSAQDVVQLPQRLFGAVLPGIAAEFAHDSGLGRVLLRQGRHDALDIGPLTYDQVLVDLVGWSDQHVSWILAWQAKAHQRCCLPLQSLIAWSKAVAEHMKNPKIDLVGAMRIRRVACGLDFRRVVV